MLIRAPTQSANRAATFAKSGSTLTRWCSQTRTPPPPQQSCSMVERLANATPTLFRWKSRNKFSRLFKLPGVEPRPRLLPDHLRLQLRTAHVRAGLRPVQQDPDQHRHRHHHHHQVDGGHDVWIERQLYRPPENGRSRQRSTLVRTRWLPWPTVCNTTPPSMAPSPVLGGN